MPSILSSRKDRLNIYLSTNIGSRFVHSGVFGKLRLPTDPIGVTNVTFLGVNSGSEIRVYYSNGEEAAGIESCTTNQILSWGVFSVGNSMNNVDIRIVHNDYKIKDFVYTSTIGNQSIPIQQELDKWYKNPI